MKTIEQLEQEAISNAIMQLTCVAKEMTLHMKTLSRNLIEVSEQMRQLQAVSMCISSNEVSGDGVGKSLPEYIEKKVLSNIAANQDYLTGDGWIEWGGGLCPVDTEIEVEYKMRFSEDVHFSKALYLEWGKDIVERDWDIVAYRIVKGE